MPVDGVSVVLCTYDGARFVREQLETVLGQTHPPLEVVVSDDGSTDDTLDVVRSVAAGTATPVHVSRNRTTLGFADNFLQASTRARGRWIAFSDQDDRWAPEKLERSLDALGTHGAVLATHPVRLVDEQGAPLPAGRRRRPRGTRVVPPGHADPWGNHFGFTMLLERSLLERIPSSERGLDDFTPGAPLAHDRWVHFLASTFGRTVLLAEPLADYRQHRSQAYGRLPHRGIRARIRTKVEAGRDQALYLAGVAAHRAALLEDWAPAGDDGAWRAGARRWRAIESHCRRRAELQGAGPVARRAGLLAGNVWHGVYRSTGRGGLGAERLVEDVVVSVLRGRATREGYFASTSSE
ncbi:Glycosyltransferase involved in cell wall bisynthesis [Geodermatophilus sp. DSM 45219]|nr:Glycosyltransferase involved in cell wall bisynthesis [Geodermatophilus sp. DSM 45219]